MSVKDVGLDGDETKWFEEFNRKFDWLSLVDNRTYDELTEDEMLHFMTTNNFASRRFEDRLLVPLDDRLLEDLHYEELRALANSFDVERDDVREYHRERMRIADKLYEEVKSEGPWALQLAFFGLRNLGLRIVDKATEMSETEFPPVDGYMALEVDEVYANWDSAYDLVMDTVTELHYRLSREWAGRNRYILAVDDDGTIVQKVQPQFEKKECLLCLGWNC